MSSFSENRNDFDDSNDSFDNMMNAGSTWENASTPGRSMAVAFVLLGGLCTTVLILVVNLLINMFTGCDPVVIGGIPLGAFLLGLAAGCGYGIAARVLQFCPTKRFVVMIIALQFILFFASRYAEFMFRSLFEPNPPGGFFEYYTGVLESIELVGKRGKAPVPLGKFGYLVELAAATLFALGVWISQGILTGIPYCSRCKVFMREKLRFAIPASAKRRTFKRKDLADQELFDQENAEAFQRAADYVSKIIERLKSGEQNDVKSITAMLTEIQKEAVIPPKELRQCWYQLDFSLSRCPKCSNFSLNMAVAATDSREKSLPALPSVCKATYANGEFQLLEGFDKMTE